MKILDFRPLTENDVDGIYDLLNNLSEDSKKNFHPHTFDRTTLNKICSSKEDHHFVLTLDNKIIGYSMLRLLGHSTPSLGLCIRNGYEKRGYGKRMTERTLQQAKNLGYKEVILNVHKDNTQAITLYRNAGFTIMSQNHTTGEIQMKKTWS